MCFGGWSSSKVDTVLANINRFRMHPVETEWHNVQGHEWPCTVSTPVNQGVKPGPPHTDDLLENHLLYFYSQH